MSVRLEKCPKWPKLPLSSFFFDFNQAVALNRIIHKINELLGKNLRPTRTTTPPGHAEHAVAEMAAAENPINFKRQSLSAKAWCSQ
jgi:hypothetical protein